MKLDQILIEQQEQSIEQLVRQFGEYVKRDCSQFLQNKSPETNLFRGVGGLTDDPPDEPIVLRKKLRRTRAITHTQEDLADHLHDLMQNDGFEATRLNGYFVTSNWSHASDFNQPYVVFPAGNYALTWHKVGSGLKDDLGGNHIFNLGADLLNLKTGWKEHTSYQDIAEAFWSEYGHLFRQGQNVDKAAAATSEIIVKARYVHMISAELFDQFKGRLNRQWYGR